MGRKKSEDGTVVMEIENGEAPPAAPDDFAGLTVSQPKKTETKRQRFLRLVERRMSAALKRISHVANLGKRGQYEYTDAEAARITESLIGAVDAVGRAFSNAPIHKSGWTL